MRKKHNGMRPQDVLILLEILARYKKQENTNDDSFNGWSLTNKVIAQDLQMSESEVSESLKRSEYAGLLEDYKSKHINKRAFLDFLLYGLKYVFPAHPEGLARGIPTAHSVAPLSENIVSNEIYVWASANGTVRGQTITPLYPTVPEIVKNDENLYTLLALVDAIRTGSARINKLASTQLEQYILG